MLAQVTSAFLYVDNIHKSIEFYNEIVGAEVSQVHAEQEGGPVTLAILRVGGFALMLHPQAAHAEEFANQRVGLGLHLQLKVEDVDAFYQHCLDEGAFLSVSGGTGGSALGLARVALKDPDGYVWSVYQDKTGGQWA